MTVLALSSLGGFVSFASTSTGALGSLIARPFAAATNRFSLSIDFALGLMLSAAAFSLIGPAAMGAANRASLIQVLMMVPLGMALVLMLRHCVGRSDRQGGGNSQLVLASVLMLHNFPEGLASGAALAGLPLAKATPILGGIALQNVPEGALMVACLSAMGWRRRAAVWGGIGSGVVEMIGGVAAGLFLSAVTGGLPLLLSFTGGAMIAAVSGELKRIPSGQFVAGLVVLPLVQHFAA